MIQNSRTGLQHSEEESASRPGDAGSFRRSIESWQIAPEAGPKAVAVLRVAAAIAVVRHLWRLDDFMIPPEDLRFPPSGTAWLSFLPVSAGLFQAMIAIGLVSGLALLVGWRPRVMAPVAAFAVFYTGWVTTLTGKVDHFHHLMWVLVIVAVSPCANAWAVRREERAGSFQWAIGAVMVMIGLIYFGAGWQKLSSAGFEWGWSDNLTNTMLNMAVQKDQPVHQWLLDWPVVAKVMGVGALVLELLFLPLLLVPRIRRWVWPAGLLFHLGVWWILGINFIGLMLMYVVFVPWDDLAARWSRSVSGEAAHGSASLQTAEARRVQRSVIVALVTMIAVFALAQEERAWPIAAYPGFRGIAPPALITFEVSKDGETTLLADHPLNDWVGSSRAHALVHAAIAHDAEKQLLEWLEVDEIRRIMVRTDTGPDFETTYLDEP